MCSLPPVTINSASKEEISTLAVWGRDMEENPRQSKVHSSAPPGLGTVLPPGLQSPFGGGSDGQKSENNTKPERI